MWETERIKKFYVLNPGFGNVSSTFTNNLGFVGILSTISLEINLNLMHLDYDSTLESLHA